MTPLSGLELVHPEVKFSEGFLFVSTDIDYHPPSPTGHLIPFLLLLFITVVKK